MSNLFYQLFLFRDLNLEYKICTYFWNTFPNEKLFENSNLIEFFEKGFLEKVRIVFERYLSVEDETFRLQDFWSSAFGISGTNYDIQKVFSVYNEVTKYLCFIDTDISYQCTL